MQHKSHDIKTLPNNILEGLEDLSMVNKQLVTYLSWQGQMCYHLVLDNYP